MSLLQPKPPRRGARRDFGLGEAGPLIGLGVQFALLVVLGVAVGHWLDQRYVAPPWGTLIGGIVGIAVGFYHFLRAVWPRRPRREGRGKDEDRPTDGA